MLLVVVGLVFWLVQAGSAQSPPASPQPQIDRDLAKIKELDQVQGGDKVRTTISRLRAFAVVLLLIAVVCAAMLASIGRTQLSLFVGIGAVVIFGFFWLILLFQSGLSGEAGVSKRPDFGVTTTGDPFTLQGTISEAVKKAVNVLTGMITPFIVIYGFWVALAVATSNVEPGMIGSFIVGAVIAFGAGILAQLFQFTL